MRERPTHAAVNTTIAAAINPSPSQAELIDATIANSPIAEARIINAPDITSIAAAPIKIFGPRSLRANRQINKLPKLITIRANPSPTESIEATSEKAPIANARAVNAPAITSIAAAPTKTFGAISLRANRLTSKVPKVITIRTNPSPTESIEATSENAPIANARAVNATDIINTAAAPAITLASSLERSSIAPTNTVNVAAIKPKPSHAESISATLAKAFIALAVMRRARATRNNAAASLRTILPIRPGFSKSRPLISFITPTNSANITVIAIIDVPSDLSSIEAIIINAAANISKAAPIFMK